MIELKDGRKIYGQPTQLKYKKKENGLHEVIIEDYIVELPSGEMYTGMLKIDNAKISLGDEGTIYLEETNFNLVDNNEIENNVFQFEIPMG